MQTLPRSRTKKLTVALTGFSGLEEPGPGASVCYALNAGWPGKLALSAWTYGNHATNVWLPGVVERLQVLPPLHAGDEQIFEAILEAHATACVDGLVPGEADVPVIARLADRLASHDIRTLLPPARHVQALTRAGLPKFLHEHQLPGPLTVNVPSVEDVAPLADRIGYPLYVRGVHSGEKVVYSAQQASLAAAQLSEVEQPGVILQSQVGGERFSVGLVADRGGDCGALVAMRVVASNGDGRTVTGTIVNLEHLERFARDFVRASQWRGPLTLDVVQPFGQGQPLVCDVKCHLPTWCQASHWGGANLAVALLQEMCNSRRQRARPRPGTMFVRSVTELPIALEDLLHLGRHGNLQGFTPVNGTRVSRVNRDKRRGVVVAVTGTSTFDVVNPGLGVARALRQAPGVSRVYGLCYGTLDSGSYQPALFDAVFRLPDSGSREAMAQRIEQIHKAHPFDVLIPCLDGELPLFIQTRHVLDALGIRYLLPHQKAFERRSKRQLFSGRLRADWGAFSIPHSRCARSVAEAMQAVEAVGLPAVVKGPLFMCFPVHSVKEAKWAWHHLASAGWGEAIVQRKISGPHYATSVVCDRDHNALAALTIKKLTVCERGSTWSAVRVYEPRLEADLAKLLRSIGWVGPAEGEFIRDEITDRFYLIEVNPRFTGWIYYSAALGCNQPSLAVRAALGKGVRLPPPANDLAFVRQTIEIPLRPSQLAALATKGYLHHA